MKLNVRFQCIDTAFSSGELSFKTTVDSGAIPSAGDDVRLFDVDDGELIRRVNSVEHRLGGDGHDVVVYLEVTDG